MVIVFNVHSYLLKCLFPYMSFEGFLVNLILSLIMNIEAVYNNAISFC